MTFAYGLMLFAVGAIFATFVCVNTVTSTEWRENERRWDRENVVIYGEKFECRRTN